MILMVSVVCLYTSMDRGSVPASFNDIPPKVGLCRWFANVTLGPPWRRIAVLSYGA